METHPLTKFVVGTVGLSIVVVAIWLGRSAGDLPVGNSGDRSVPDTSADSAAKDKDEHPPISPAGPYPQVKLDEEKHTFSVMVVGVDGTHSFVVHNEGEAPLILKEGPTTCKCTISQLQADEIPPGGSASIDVTWKARAVNPQFQQTATIWTNDPKMKQFDLVVTGKITQSIEISPQGTWFLGDLSQGKKSSVSGSLYSYVLDSFEIDETQISTDSLLVDIQPLSRERLDAMKAKSGYLVNVSGSPDVPVGAFREQLTFEVKKHDISIEVVVEGSRTGPISFLSAGRTRWNPKSMAVNFGEFDAKQGASGTLLLFVRGLQDGDFEFISVESDPDDLQVELKPDRNFHGSGRKKYELQFKVPPGRRPEIRSANRPAVVKIKTNHPEAEILKFRLFYISR